MRIDMLLNKLCLTKTRSIAKNAADKGLLFINGKPAKASAIVRQDDEILLKLYGYANLFRIIEIPSGNVSKKDAGNYYEIISREPLE